VPTPATKVSLGDRLAAWRYAFRTTNPPEQGVVDGVTRWIVVTRAGVLPMTVTSALFAALLAVGHKRLNWVNLGLAIVGIVIAHLANNLTNDLWDTELGSDTANYPRALYAPHPILSGLVTKRQLLAAIVACDVVDLAIMLVLWDRVGWPVLVFALSGAFLSWAYTAPPLRLKQVGLGELDVLLVWGPLMVGGVYYSGLGRISWHVLVAATFYALLPTSVLMGKHIDKRAYDRAAHIRTLPVLLGTGRSKALTQGLMVAYYLGIVGCVVLHALPWPALLTLLALPKLVTTMRRFNEPKPVDPPPENVVWPLWWAPLAFVHTRRAGTLLVLGLLASAIWRLH
jgi:1,4-dihydroxy-2-naphthoate octaprenyltransferase